MEDKFKIGKEYYIKLGNNEFKVFYTGKVIEKDDDHIWIIDKYGTKRALNKTNISEAVEMR